MRISNEELELFKDWKPGQAITIDQVSIGLLIQEVRASRAAIEGFWTRQAGEHQCGCGEWPECTHTLHAHELCLEAQGVRPASPVPTSAAPVTETPTQIATELGACTESGIPCKR